MTRGDLAGVGERVERVDLLDPFETGEGWAELGLGVLAAGVVGDGDEGGVVVGGRLVLGVVVVGVPAAPERCCCGWSSPP